jgi:hypothetical protein
LKYVKSAELETYSGLTKDCFCKVAIIYSLNKTRIGFILLLEYLIDEVADFGFVIYKAPLELMTSVLDSGDIKLGLEILHLGWVMVGALKYMLV